jgi:hypothetical protein
MDALMPKNIRGLFLFDWCGIENAVVQHGTARETHKNIFSVALFSGETFRRQHAAWYGGIKHIRKIPSMDYWTNET